MSNTGFICFFFWNITNDFKIVLKTSCSLIDFTCTVYYFSFLFDVFNLRSGMYPNGCQAEGLFLIVWFSMLAVNNDSHDDVLPWLETLVSSHIKK